MPGKKRGKNSLQIKKRFIQAIEFVSKAHYPAKLQTEILRSIDIAPTNYYKMRAGTSASYPTLEHCYLLCTQYSISAEWLITGKGIMQYMDEKKIDVKTLLLAAIAALPGKK